MNPLLIPTLTALGVYFGAARLTQSASTSGNQNAGLNTAFAVSKNNRDAAVQLCATY
jgi:hypothetical protein